MGYYTELSDFGEVVVEIDLSEPYEYDVYGVIRRDDGYYIGTDSGCSCYSPWENYDTLADFTGPLTAEQAREEFESLVLDSYGVSNLEDGELEEALAAIV